MASDRKNPKDPNASFSFGVRELREARMARELALEAPPRRTLMQSSGFDPYNTTGSFDRKQHWARVGKR